MILRGFQVHRRHAEKLLATVAVVRHRSIVNGEETERFVIQNPHWNWVGIEQKLERLFACRAQAVRLILIQLLSSHPSLARGSRTGDQPEMFSRRSRSDEQFVRKNTAGKCI